MESVPYPPYGAVSSSALGTTVYMTPAEAAYPLPPLPAAPTSSVPTYPGQAPSYYLQTYLVPLSSFVLPTHEPAPFPGFPLVAASQYAEPYPMMAAPLPPQLEYAVLCDNPACLTDPGYYPPAPDASHYPPALPPDAVPAYSGLSYPGGRPVAPPGFSSASTLSDRAAVFQPSSAQDGPDGDKLSVGPVMVADTTRIEYFDNYGKKHAAEIKTLLDFAMEEYLKSKNLEAAIDQADTKEAELIRKIAEMQKKTDNMENDMKADKQEVAKLDKRILQRKLDVEKVDTALLDMTRSRKSKSYESALNDYIFEQEQLDKGWIQVQHDRKQNREDWKKCDEYGKDRQAQEQLIAAQSSEIEELKKQNFLLENLRHEVQKLLHHPNK